VRRQEKNQGKKVERIKTNEPDRHKARVAMAKMAERGWQADACMIPPDETGGLMLEKQLATTAYDCVVAFRLLFFETVINAVLSRLKKWLLGAVAAEVLAG
jgi:hypothetical protein